MSDPSTLCTAFQQTAARTPTAVALRDFVSGLEITWAEYAHRVTKIAAGLAAHGLQRGDAVALLLSNRPEFHLADTAAIHLGAVPISIYNTSSPEQIAHILTDSAARVVITELQHLPRVLDCRVPLDLVVCVDGTAEGAITLTELEGQGDPDFAFDSAWTAVGPDDLVTIIYTSGTTGPPKGVELTHANLLAEMEAVTKVLSFSAGDVGLSYLPSAHIADRLASHYVQIFFGVRVVCLPDLTRLAEALPVVRPTYWAAVPRVLEKMRSRIEDALAAAPAPRRWAYRAATGARNGVARRVADRLVLSKVRTQLGLDRARWIISGAAPLSPAVVQYFLNMGIPVCDVWGMSETCGVGTMNRPGGIRPGTVGTALDGVELRLAGDGELQIRGPIVTRGYHRDPERTAAAFDGDWLRTGDVATIDGDGYVRIVGRTKELIINAAGKNMSPALIEGAILSACPLVATAVVVGDGRPYNVALVVLDPDALAALREREPDTDPQTVVAQGIEAANRTLSRVEQIKRFEILAGPWMPGGDELTPTLKLRRSAVTRKYADTIDRLYAPGAAG